jgi:bacterioferritin-associated ferredoxin
LAITVVDRRFDSTGKTAQVWLPWELDDDTVKVGNEVKLTGFEGEEVGAGTVRHIRSLKWMDKRRMVQVVVPSELATRVAGIRIQDSEQGSPVPAEFDWANDDVKVCLCERVSKNDIARLVRMGIRDLNAIKAATRCGMGACNGKTCENLVRQVFAEEGIPPDSVTGYVKRPFMMEVPLQALLQEERK